MWFINRPCLVGAAALVSLLVLAPGLTAADGPTAQSGSA